MFEHFWLNSIGDRLSCYRSQVALAACCACHHRFSILILTQPWLGQFVDRRRVKQRQSDFIDFARVHIREWCVGLLPRCSPLHQVKFQISLSSLRLDGLIDRISGWKQSLSVAAVVLEGVYDFRAWHFCAWGNNIRLFYVKIYHVFWVLDFRRNVF